MQVEACEVGCGGDGGEAVLGVASAEPATATDSHNGCLAASGVVAAQTTAAAAKDVGNGNSLEMTDNEGADLTGLLESWSDVDDQATSDDDI